jgi:hypothetical protein
MESKMSAEALVAAITAIKNLDVNESLTLKGMLEQHIKANQRPLGLGDVVIYTGRSDSKFRLTQNHSRLVVLEMRRSRCLVQLEGSVGKKSEDFPFSVDRRNSEYQAPFLCSAEVLAPTGEKNTEVKAPIKRRRQRRTYEF